MLLLEAQLKQSPRSSALLVVESDASDLGRRVVVASMNLSHAISSYIHEMFYPVTGCLIRAQRPALTARSLSTNYAGIPMCNSKGGCPSCMIDNEGRQESSVRGHTRHTNPTQNGTPAPQASLAQRRGVRGEAAVRAFPHHGTHHGNTCATRHTRTAADPNGLNPLLLHVPRLPPKAHSCG